MCCNQAHVHPPAARAPAPARLRTPQTALRRRRGQTAAAAHRAAAVRRKRVFEDLNPRNRAGGGGQYCRHQLLFWRQGGAVPRGLRRTSGQALRRHFQVPARTPDAAAGGAGSAQALSSSDATTQAKIRVLDRVLVMVCSSSLVCRYCAAPAPARPSPRKSPPGAPPTGRSLWAWRSAAAGLLRSHRG